MKCPSCGHEAGDAEFCPSCLASLRPAAHAQPAPAGEAPSTSAPAPTAAPRSDLRKTVVAMVIAGLLGSAAGGIALWASRRGSPDPECTNLCQFADVPAVAGNPRWQEQVGEHNCRCNALPKDAPPPQPVAPSGSPR